MPKICFRGVASNKIYSWATGVFPSTGLDANNHYKSSFSYNGETLVICNMDGAVLRGSASASPDGVRPGVTPGTWETI